MFIIRLFCCCCQNTSTRFYSELSAVARGLSFSAVPVQTFGGSCEATCVIVLLLTCLLTYWMRIVILYNGY